MLRCDRVSTNSSWWSGDLEMMRTQFPPILGSEKVVYGGLSRGVDMAQSSLLFHERRGGVRMCSK